MIRLRNACRRHRIASPSRRLWLKSLEDRTVPATFVVNIPGDAGTPDLIDPNKGDIRYCIGQANANAGDDTIVFDAGITAISLNAQLDIIDPAGLLIDGNGLVTLTNIAAAGPLSRLFDITAATASEIEFRGLTMKNGLVSVGGGGAIQAANTNLKLVNCTFDGNRANTGAGGAVSTLTAASTLNITDCTFSNNIAKSTGGGLQVSGTATITMNGSTFTNNLAEGTFGGAINVGTTSVLNIGTTAGCTFTNNRSTTHGGAIHTAGSVTATIDNSTFSGNRNLGATGSGGAISFGTSVSVTLNNSQIVNNIAGSIGGGIRCAASTTTITLNSSTVSGNLAGSSTGGGLSMFGGQGKAYYSTFANNTAGSIGGGIYGTACTLTIINCTISGNEARSATAGGGGINIATGPLSISNSTIANNRVTGATAIGGGIRKSGATGAVTINSTVIAGNTATSGLGSEMGASSAITVNGANNLLGFGGVNNFNFTNAPINGDARFAPLANYGGPTPTLPFRYNSPLIDQGNTAGLGSFTNDQRGTGFSRTIDDGSVVDGSGGPTDIGAVEGKLTVPWAEATAGVGDVTMTTTSPFTFSVIYEDETGINPSSLNTGEIKVSGPGGFLSFTPAVTATIAGPGANQTTVFYSFDPPAGGWQTIHGGTYTINLLANKLFDNDTPTPQSAKAQALATFRVTLPGPTSLIVDSTADVIDGNYTGGNLSLREALELTNAATGGVDTITFAAALNGQTIALTLGEMPIVGSTKIAGPGPSLLTIDANKQSRIFNINDGTGTSIDVALSGLRLTGGFGAGGGAIVMAPEVLTMDNMVLTANNSTSLGGAIWFSTSAANVLTISNSVVSNNTSSGNGGAIGTNGGANTITITNSTFSGNKSSANGGAIDTGGGGGLLDVTNSSFTGNAATAAGGVVSAGYAKFDFKNCTLSGNTAGGTGGAANGYNNNQFFTNCTIVNNVASSGGGAITINKASSTTAKVYLISSTVVNNRSNTGNGGGVRLNTTSTAAGVILSVTNSIVSGNGIGASLPGTPSDLFRAGTAPNNTADVTFSAIGASAGFTLSGMSGNNLAFGTSLNLGPLQDNGGPTFTMLPNSGSPVIDAGDNVVSLLANDQRGKARTFDDLTIANVGDGTDIGAVEVSPSLVAPPTVTTVLVNNGAAQRSLVTSIKVTFSETVSFPLGINSAFVVERTALGPSLGPVSIVAMQSGPDVTITFVTGGAVDVDPGNSLQDGKYKLTIVANNVMGQGGKLDGDGDMIAEGSPIDDKTAVFHRLFGDGNGDGGVNSTDFALFRSVFGLSGPSIFDFNNDSNTGAPDFAQFRGRFGLNGYLP